MRIAVISTASGMFWGGSEELWAATAHEALNERHQVVVSVCPSPGTPPKIIALQQRGAIIFNRNLWKLKFRRLHRLTQRLRRLAQLDGEPISPFQDVFRFRPDVVCINQSWTYESLYLSDLLKLLYAKSVPYVVVCHFSSDNIPDRTIREAAIEFFSRACRVVFVSTSNLRTTERQLAQSLSNAIVLQNPVNLTDFTAPPWPSSGPLCMANVARLEATYKSQDILLEVLSSEVWRQRDWRLRLAGAGPDRDYLEKLTQYYRIAEKTEFLGHVADIRSLWAKNHLLVLPSRAEGIPLALVEAMLCGRPAVVTDVGGNVEWVAEPATGFVAEAPTATSFGAALERAWQARDHWQKLGMQAHQQALRKFDPSSGRSLLKVVLDASHSYKPD